MIYHQVPIKLSEEQVQRLKSLNFKVLRHPEEGFGLRLNILEGLKTELSGIVKETPEFMEALGKINRSGDYYDLQFLLVILKTSYQIGKEAGFPGIENLSNLIKRLENS